MQSSLSTGSITTFIARLKELTFESTATWIVLDGMERLNGNALSCLVRLQEMCQRNIGLIVIGESTWTSVTNDTIGIYPRSIHFPIYQQTNIMNILERDYIDTAENNEEETDVTNNENNASLVLYTNFLKQIWSFFHQIVNDLRQWKYLSERLYPLYKWSTELNREHPHYLPMTEHGKLQYRMEPAYKLMLSRVYYNDITSNELFNVMRFPKIVSKNTTLTLTNSNGKRKTPSSSSSSSSDTTITPPQQPKNGRQHTELPAMTKWLLIAAYLSSHNPKDTDMKFFSTLNVGRNKKRRVSRSVHTAAQHKKRAMDGPKVFDLERLFAVFHSLLALVDDEGSKRANTASTADLGSQVSSLIRLNLLTKIGSKKKKSALDMMRLKCNVQKSIINTISNELEFNIKKYLFDVEG